MKENVTYILRCVDGTLYTGWTNDLSKRLATHNAGTGAKYTRSRRPVTLVYWEIFPTRKAAMRFAITRIVSRFVSCMLKRVITAAEAA